LPQRISGDLTGRRNGALAIHLIEKRKHLVTVKLVAKRFIENRREIESAGQKLLDAFEHVGVDRCRYLRCRHVVILP
jgi:hypothetical protein